MTEQHSQTESYENSWKFTGHELDKETGLYYAGARYYEPRWSVWLSVDPLAEEFPSWTPYHYVHQNPINMIDPFGMSAEPPVNGLDWFADDTGQYFWNEEKNTYEHYQYNDDGSYSFSGYYSADEFSEPVGDYSIIFDLSNATPKDEYDPSKTIWSVASPIVAYLATVSEIKDISDPDKYPGVQILSSEKMNGAITLGNLIITNPGMEDANTLDHEYGHYLDYKHHFKYDKVKYLKDIGYPSLRSAAGSGEHSQTTTEKRANRLGGEWSGNKHLKNKHRNEK